MTTSSLAFKLIFALLVMIIFQIILKWANALHCVKDQNFTYFPGVKILWKDTVSVEFLGESFETL